MTRFVLPLGLFVAVAALLAVGLGRDPSLVPSPLLGRQAPSFSLPRVRNPERTIGSQDIHGQVALLNVWATWCASCRQEHAMLVAIARSREVPLYGLNYKDRREDAVRWLERLDDPYVASAFDPDGRVALDLGVYGAPETYVLARDGTIAYKHVGPITPQVWERTLLPLVRELKRAAG